MEQHHACMLKAPSYTGNVVGPDPRPRVALAVESMRHHMSDEGWQIMAGLEGAGWNLCGRGLPNDLTDVKTILRRFDPSMVLVQDKREWDPVRAGRTDFRDPAAAFRNVAELRDRQDVFKLTVLKDAHQRPSWHAESAEEIGCHAWVVYYDPAAVCKLAPYVRPRHVVRTWHTIDPELVPPFDAFLERSGTLLSGAISGAYPLRRKLAIAQGEGGLGANVTKLRHPGYHRDGCNTPGFLRLLSSHKVAICTASVYGYELRKMVEATACGCAVITNLPPDRVMPEIDCNFERVGDDASVEFVAALARQLEADYDPERQRHLADRAKAFYDFRAMGQRLAEDVEAMRLSYSSREERP